MVPVFFTSPSSSFIKVILENQNRTYTLQQSQDMPLHESLDPDVIMRTPPLESMDEIQPQDPPSIFQKHQLGATATPMGSSKTTIQSSPSPVECHIPSVSAERGRTTSSPELGNVKPPKTCQACEMAAMAMNARGVCDCERKSSLSSG